MKNGFFGLGTRLSLWVLTSMLTLTATAHDYGTNGVCRDAGCSEPYQMPQMVDGWYELQNAGNVEWFSAEVNKGGNNLTLCARMTADIDMAGVTHTPIGVTAGTKFNGQFDGQGHRILNLVMTNKADLQGFFGGLRGGGTTIRNLIIDRSCRIEGGTRVGGIAAFAQTQISGPIVIENCVNEGTIAATGKGVGGILGGSMSPHPVIHIINCLNKGDVTGADETAAIAGWNGDNGGSMIRGCLNLGTLKGMDSSRRNLFRYSGAQTIADNYDLNAPSNGSQGVGTAWTTDAPVTSGELCYHLNGGVSDGGWRQTLGADEHPWPFETSERVYLNGVTDCRGHSVGEGNGFSNNNLGQTTLGHSFKNGFCTVCGEEDPTAEPRRRKVFIVAGQSNTDGRAPLSDYPAEIQGYATDGARYCHWTYANGSESMWKLMGGKLQPYRPYTDNNALSRCGFDGVLYNLIEKQISERFYVIKESRGGTAIDTLCSSSGNLWWCADADWLAKSSPRSGHSLTLELTENISLCIDNVLSLLQAGYDIKCIIWHQGCSDRSQADHYYNNLRTLVTYLRAFLVEKTGEERYATLPFLAGSVNPNSTQYNSTVEMAKRQLAHEDANFYVINLDNCELGSDNLHFSAKGNTDAAKRFMARMKALGMFDSEAGNAIESPDSDINHATSEAVFNLAGQRLSKPQRGMNIVARRKVVMQK